MPHPETTVSRPQESTSSTGPAVDTRGSDRVVIPVILALSIAVPLLIACLLLFPETLALDLGIDRGTLPAFHALLNGTTGLILLTALWAVRSKRYVAHKNLMLTAFGFSAIFLVSYVVSKLNADPIHFGGSGAARPAYFFILISHILMSVPVLPLAMFAIYRGLTRNYVSHRRIVRWAFPIWLYVSVTGVLVYLFMRPYY